MKQQITKNAIKTAYRSLLSQKPMDKITVRDIVDECGLTRNTFYYYYCDIYEVAKEIVTDTTHTILNDLYNGRLTWSQFCENLLTILKQNYKLMSNMFRISDDEILLKHFDNAVQTVFVFYVDSKSQNLSLKDEDKDFVVNMLNYMFRGVFFKYIKTGKIDTLTQFVNRFEDIFSDEFLKLLNK